MIHGTMAGCSSRGKNRSIRVGGGARCGIFRFRKMPDATPIASATELTVRYGPHTVLERATIAVHEGDRIGLVGRNGCGKSTFLRIAAGELQPDSGVFTRKRELVTGYLSQAFSLQEDATVLENIRAGAAPVLALIHEYEN